MKTKNNMSLIFQQAPNGDKYFDGDQTALDAYQEKNAGTDYGLDLSLYPEPYAGNPDAKVYLLNGNPGWGSLDNQLMTSNQPAWDKMMQHSYDLNRPQTLYWLDSY